MFNSIESAVLELNSVKSSCIALHLHFAPTS